MVTDEIADLVEKIKEWRKLAEEFEDYFVRFALEYFCFNALLRLTYYLGNKLAKDRDLINELKKDTECRTYV